MPPIKATPLPENPGPRDPSLVPPPPYRSAASASAIVNASPTATGTPPKQPAVLIPLYLKLITGGIAGVIGTTVIFPLDMVKTRLQNQSASAVGGLRYAGPVDCFKKIVAVEGYGGLYQGLRPNLIGVAPEKAIKLSFNEAFRESFTARNGDGRIRLWQEIVAGGSAGFFQVAATNPMEIVKLRMQLAGESGVKKTLQETVGELGMRGMYKGTFATWLRDVPFSFIFFPLFANLKTAFNGENNLLGLIAAGALSGSIAAGSVTPCDVIKTRLQVVGSKYTSIGHAARTILKEEGWRAFFKGLAPRMTVQAPLFGITMLCFDLLKRRIQANSK